MNYVLSFLVYVFGHLILTAPLAAAAAAAAATAGASNTDLARSSALFYSPCRRRSRRWFLNTSHTSALLAGLLCVIKGLSWTP